MSYISNIADSIIRHSSGNAILGPEIYTAIAEWEKREIPEELVLVSIKEACRKGEGNSGSQLSVEVFQNTVIQNFRYWLSNGRRRMVANV